MELRLVRADVAAREVDAVVNAANSGLAGGGGVDGAIHRAGGPAIMAECRALLAGKLKDGLPTGQAVATTAGDLPARWVIHTVGPVYRVDRDQRALLRSCYSSSLLVAEELGATSIAFPLVSSGVFGWPKADAIRQALQALVSARTEVEFAELVLHDDVTLELAKTLRAAEYGEV